jgi:hypothetical protein
MLSVVLKTLHSERSMAKQRQSNWAPVIVSNSGNQVGEDPGSPASAALLFTYIDGFPEDESKFLDQATQRRATFHFAMWVAFAVVLPAVIGLGIYEAAKSIVLIAS